MLKFLKIICLFAIAAPSLTANENTAESRLYLADVQQLYCRGEADSVVMKLSQFESLYPESPYLIFVQQRLATFYIADKKYQKAISILHKGLSLPIKLPGFGHHDTCGLFTPTESRLVHAELQLDLAKIYADLGAFPTAKHYLRAADSAIIENNIHCGNGMYQAFTMTSKQFSEVLIQSGDTMAAIHRLVLYAFLGETPSAETVDFLKTLLLLKYTVDEIKSEVSAGLDSMQIIESENEASILTMRFFGQEIQKSGRQTLEYYRDYYHKSPLVQALNSTQ
ncbi:MAG: hypothetical protein JJU02_08380 [Cryomorphaceae bacterium]|nr:hypothetical protein [Cryomorphaceae bacterium]